MGSTEYPICDFITCFVCICVAMIVALMVTDCLNAGLFCRFLLKGGNEQERWRNSYARIREKEELFADVCVIMNIYI